jgi:hypothetical protein
MNCKIHVKRDYFTDSQEHENNREVNERDSKDGNESDEGDDGTSHR